jgi:hypothetical protein
MIGELFAMNGQRLWEEISQEQRGQNGHDEILISSYREYLFTDTGADKTET